MSHQLNLSTLDQFYTIDLVAQQCVDMLKAHVQMDDFDIHLEPSAGTGSFYNCWTWKKLITWIGLIIIQKLLLHIWNVLINSRKRPYKII